MANLGSCALRVVEGQKRREREEEDGGGGEAERDVERGEEGEEKEER